MADVAPLSGAADNKDRFAVELRDYLRLARRHWQLIVGAMAVAVTIGALATMQMTPQYASRARVFISTSPDNSAEAYQGGLFSQQRVASYADMMNGLELAQRVVDELTLKMTAEQLSQKIKSATVPDTVLLDVTVTDESPSEAQRINEAVVKQLQAMVKDIETPPGATNALLKTTIIDPPRLPASPVSPRPLRNLALSLMLGLLLGLGLAALRELLDTSVKRVEDVPGLGDVPLLGQLSFDSDVAAHPLISTLPSHAPRVEAFRVLRTNLQFLDVDNTSKAFVVTSSVPGEGKSTTAVNIALALQQGGKRVLLVDADLRRPQGANLLGLEGSVGLTTLLVGQIELNDAVQVETSANLHVITAGAIPPNPAELLQSQRMGELLEQMRAEYDVIIIDAPPLLPVTDAALLADLTDGALLVVRHSKTSKDQVAGALARLRSVDAEALGLIFNMMPVKRGGYSSYGYGYGYGYGYAPVEEEPGKRAADKKQARRQARAERGAAKAEARAVLQAEKQRRAEEAQAERERLAAEDLAQRTASAPPAAPAPAPAPAPVQQVDAAPEEDRGLLASAFEHQSDPLFDDDVAQESTPAYDASLATYPEADAAPEGYEANDSDESYDSVNGEDLDDRAARARKYARRRLR